MLTLRLAAYEAVTWVRARLILARATLTGRTLARTTREWAANPVHWCTRPGCPVCWARGCPA